VVVARRLLVHHWLWVPREYHPAARRLTLLLARLVIEERIGILNNDRRSQAVAQAAADMAAVWTRA
jgi:hypothetical protein